MFLQWDRPRPSTSVAASCGGKPRQGHGHPRGPLGFLVSGNLPILSARPCASRWQGMERRAPFCQRRSVTVDYSPVSLGLSRKHPTHAAASLPERQEATCRSRSPLPSHFGQEHEAPHAAGPLCRLGLRACLSDATVCLQTARLRAPYSRRRYCISPACDCS